MNLDKKVHREQIGVFLVLEFFSIESIPEIIPSTDEQELYEGAMFKNKDELKTSFGKYALK